MTRPKRAAFVLLFCVGVLFGWASPSSATGHDPATATATCGSYDTPCVMELDGQQYLAVMFTGATVLLLSLVTFLRREGRALRV